jgi:hypothetical protein
MTVKELPTFKGYTVDVRLQQFRRFPLGKTGEFIDFKSEKGDQLLAEWIKSDPDALSELSQEHEGPQL